MTTLGNQTVTVSYTEGEVTKTTDYTITVSAPPALASIALSGNYPTTFYQNDAFTHQGMVVTATYEDNSTKDVTSSATFSTPDMTTTGTKEVTVSYTEGDVTKTASYNITVQVSNFVNDEILPGDLAATSTTYEDFSNVTKPSGAVYAGNSAHGNDAIQLRSKNSNSGIVSTTSGGNIKKVSVTWNSNTDSGRTLDVYGSNTPYASASDLYNASTQGTKVGSIVNGTSTTLTIDGDYAYIGVRSNNGAMYLDGITFSWEAGDKQPAGLSFSETAYTANLGETFTAPTLTNPNNLTVTYDSSDPTVATVDENTGAVTLVAAGTTTITATFAGNDEYEAGNASYTLTVVDPNAPGAQNNPYTVAQARTAIDNGTGVNGVYATGIVSAIVTEYNSQYGNITYDISTDGTTESAQLRAYRGKSFNGDNFTSADDIKVGDQVVIYGNLTKYQDIYEFAQDNRLISLVRPQAPAGLAYATTEVAKNLGDAAFTNELTNPNNLTVTYSSSDPAVATVNAENGEVTLVGEGTTTITANSAETAEYLAGTASYTLTVTDPTVYVAQIGTTKYASLEEAFAAAQDGETITLLANCAGNGIKVTPAGKFATGLTVDFAGFTYTVDGETVGSTGTETNGFQLLKDNKVTFQNGTITSTKAKILVQNYSDLTLNNMTLTLNNPDYTGAYTLSNNNGNIVIDGSTINANPAGGFAFDVCRYSSYRSVSVTVTGNSQINGDVEVSASKSDPKDGFKLLLESGTLTGDIVLDQTAKNAMESNPDKAEVTKNNTFNQTAPEGYEWHDNGDGTSTLVKSIVVLTLNETEDNSGVLEANNGKVADVTIGRSFVNTSYQTLSLPFDLTQAQVEAVFGTSTRVQSFTGAATDAEKNIVLNFTAATGIEAGKPYLILPFNNVENPTFTGVTVSNVAAQTVTGEQADFIANINATEYAANEQQMYLGADNKLYFNNTTATMKGFRAYFMLKGTTPGKTVGFSFDGTPTGITTITGNDNGNVNVNGWYTLDGQKLNAAPTQKGVYINNGRKVVIK